jgi:hypothetical protein
LLLPSHVHPTHCTYGTPLPHARVQTAADQIAANYHAVVAGKGLLPATVVDRERGY